MKNHKKEPEVKPWQDVLDMPPEAAQKYIEEHASLIHKEYDKGEIVAVYTHANSTLYKNGKPTADRRQTWTINQLFSV